ncbi:MAG TPA: TIGR04283 family arsenosugar biosynthesis glycosyltransferase [Rhodothermales bacterium]|nr:TIGR04283 family arsenosugar biosynthesis glycosyltransferase [Rhodothermales bacterium]
MKISVVIPARNEAARIEQTLHAVTSQPGPFEVIVVDGGSDDATKALAALHAQVLSSAPGRARQMNAGAALATGEVVLFLHADTLLPPDAFTVVRTTLIDPAVEGGAFRLAFDTDTLLLRFYSFCTHFALPRICFGDRAHFVRRRVFKEIGGFPDVPMFEDLELVQMLHQRGGFRFLPQAVTTAARRFEQYGLFRQQLRNTYLWLRYQTGTPPEQLAHLYPYR